MQTLEANADRSDLKVHTPLKLILATASPLSICTLQARAPPPPSNCRGIEEWYLMREHNKGSIFVFPSTLSTLPPFPPRSPSSPTSPSANPLFFPVWGATPRRGGKRIGSRTAQLLQLHGSNLALHLLELYGQLLVI